MRRTAKPYRPSIEALEERAVPAVLFVTTTQDVVDDNDHQLSLREAINQANLDTANTEIVLQAGATYQLNLAGAGEDANATGDLDIRSDAGNIKIDAGTGTATINAAALDRAFHILAGGSSTIELSGLVLTGGAADSGGAVRADGGNLVLTNCAVAGNLATAAFGGGIAAFNANVTLTGSTVTGNRAGLDGGGINVQNGSLTLTGSSVTGNQAPRFGGGIAGENAAVHLAGSTIGNNRSLDDGGGLCVSGSLDATDSAISGNVSGDRGGAASITGALSLTRATLEHNTAASDGGAVMVVDGDVAIADSWLHDNQSGRRGGAIWDGTTAGPRGFAMTGSTVSTNSAVADGGGLTLDSSGGVITANLSNSTISSNTASDDGGGLFTQASINNFLNVTIAQNTARIAGGGIFNEAGAASFANTLLAGNAADNYIQDNGAAQSLGHNLSSDNSLAGAFTAATLDQNAVDPQLAPLANNGGLTPTHALLPGSAAIDAADPTLAPATDQRGSTRPSDGNGDGVALPDIGAFEAQNQPTGQVTASLVNGVLTITGTDQVNRFTVREDDAGAYSVLGATGTAIVADGAAAAASASFTGVTSIVIDTNTTPDGDPDLVTFQGSTADGTSLAGNLTVTGSGALTLVMTDGFNVLGQFQVNYSGPGTLTTTINGANTTLGSLLVYDGDGDQTTTLSGASVASWVSINDGAGTNAVHVSDVQIGTFLSYVGAGSNTFDVTRANIGENVGSVFTGDGSDTVTMTDSTIAGRLLADQGGGSNLLALNNVTLNGGLYHFGTGTETVRILGSTLNSFVTVNAPDSTDPVGVELNGTSVHGWLSVVTGSGDDLLSLTSTRIGDLTTFLAGAGNDGVRTDDVTFGGALNLIMGDGNDAVLLQGPNPNAVVTEVDGDFTLLAGNGTDVVQLGSAPGNRARFLAAVTIDGGAEAADGDQIDGTYADTVNATPVVTNF